MDLSANNKRKEVRATIYGKAELFVGIIHPENPGGFRQDLQRNKKGGRGYVSRGRLLFKKTDTLEPAEADSQPGEFLVLVLRIPLFFRVR